VTVVSVTPTYAGLSGTGSLEGIREYVKVYTAVTDSADDGVMTVGNDSRLPRKWSVFTWRGEVDPGALCWKITPRQDPDNQLVWEVTCEFSSDMKGGPGGALGGDPDYDVDNPLLAPPEVSWGNWVENEVITHDVNGKAILNSAGHPYDPPLMRRRKQRMVTIIRNEAEYPVAIDQEYVGCINSDVFYDWPVGTAMLEDVTATSHFGQAMKYWRVKYEIRFRKPDWKQDVLRAGTIYLEQTGTPLNQVWEEVLPTDKDGIYHTSPILLNEDGEKLTQAEVEQRRAVPQGQPGGLYDSWDVFKSKPFNALNL
jgi:hypothetical protein